MLNNNKLEKIIYSEYKKTPIAEMSIGKYEFIYNGRADGLKDLFSGSTLEISHDKKIRLRATHDISDWGNAQCCFFCFAYQVKVLEALATCLGDHGFKPMTNFDHDFFDYTLEIDVTVFGEIESLLTEFSKEWIQTSKILHEEFRKKCGLK